MKRPLCLLSVLAVLLLATTSSRGQCTNNSEAAQCEMTAGISPYKNAHFDEAIEHFRRAIQLNPELPRAHVYLGAALAQHYIPGMDTPENVRYAEQAIAEFSTVLRQQSDNSPDKLSATREIATLYLYMKKFEDAKQHYQKLIDIDPNDSAAYYSIGVIDWTESYKPRMEAKAKLGLKPDEPLADLATCYQLAQDNLARVEDGIKMLMKALELRPDYDDAMAYMNLMYRERADLRCNDPAARAADGAEADKWVALTMATKKAKQEQAQKPHPDEP